MVGTRARGLSSQPCPRAAKLADIVWIGVEMSKMRPTTTVVRVMSHEAFVEVTDRLETHFTELLAKCDIIALEAEMAKSEKCRTCGDVMTISNPFGLCVKCIGKV